MCKCIKAKEIMNGVRSVDQWCAKKVDRFNRILRQFYLHTAWLKYNYESENINADGTIQTEYPIYKTIGFFGKWCSSDCLLDFDDVCCGDGLKALKMHEIFWWNLQQWQYIQECEDQIKAALPAGTNSRMYVYSKWPKTITSMEDEICIQPAMLVGLEYLIESFHYENQWELNNATLATNKFNEWLAKIKETAKWITYRIESWGTRSKNINPFTK